jgi:hypothetical protein
MANVFIVLDVDCGDDAVRVHARRLERTAAEPVLVRCCANARTALALAVAAAVRGIGIRGGDSIEVIENNIDASK